MDARRIIGDLVSTLLAVFMGLTALLLSIRYLARPQGMLDWAVQLSGAATVALIIFFLVWGHFQRTPRPKPLVRPDAALPPQPQPVTPSAITVASDINSRNSQDSRPL